MYIEEGIDLQGNPIWFVLQEADLLASFSLEVAAQEYIDNNS